MNYSKFFLAFTYTSSVKFLGEWKSKATCRIEEYCENIHSNADDEVDHCDDDFVHGV
jgi:hypothetical protein